MNRRDFVLSGATASLVTLAPLSLASVDATAAGMATIPLHRVVFDERFAASVQFGRAAHAAGAAVAGICGDVTNLWRYDLGPHWASGRGPQAVAGMTSPESLLCLEQMARDHWLRVTVRVEHAASRQGERAHRVIAAQSALGQVCRALQQVQWPSRLGEQLAICPRNRPMALVSTRVQAAPGVELDAPLVSWVISA